VLDVVEEVVDGGALAALLLAELGVGAEADQSTRGCDRSYLLVGDVARVVGQGPRARVGEHGRRLGDRCSVERRARAGVRQVDGHADPVHLQHDALAVGGEAEVGALHAAVTEPVAFVVDEVGDAHAELMEDGHEVRVCLERVGGLEPVDESERAVGVMPADVVDRPDPPGPALAHLVEAQVVEDALEGRAGAFSWHGDGLVADGDAVVAVLVDAVRAVDVGGRAHEHGAAEAVDDQRALMQALGALLLSTVESEVERYVHVGQLLAPGRR